MLFTKNITQGEHLGSTLADLAGAGSGKGRMHCGQKERRVINPSSATLKLTCCPRLPSPATARLIVRLPLIPVRRAVVRDFFPVVIKFQRTLMHHNHLANQTKHCRCSAGKMFDWKRPRKREEGKKKEKRKRRKKKKEQRNQRKKKKEKKKEKRKMFAVYLLCVLRARYDLLLDTEGLCNTSCDSVRLWMVCGSNTPPDEGANFLHLGV